MFLFGFLKFFPPFSGWFDSQIKNSGLPLIAIPFGIFTEMLVGLLFLIPWLSDVFSFQRRRQINVVASLIRFRRCWLRSTSIFSPMYPAKVLPLGIKMPFIPLTVLVLAALNGFFFFKLPSEGSK